MTKALISLGANTPDKKQRLTDTIDAIARIAKIVANTPIYETPAEGSTATLPYANALILIETEAEYDELRATFKQWEAQAGRTPESKAQGNIPLDIDIVTWNDKVIKERDMEFNYMKKGLQYIESKL